MLVDVSDTSYKLTASDPDEYDPMLELLCHAHIGVCMEALLDDHSNRYHSRYSDPLV